MYCGIGCHFIVLCKPKLLHLKGCHQIFGDTRVLPHCLVLEGEDKKRRYVAS